MAVARVTKITASSTAGFQGAVEEGIARASKTIRGITGRRLVPYRPVL